MSWIWQGSPGGEDQMGTDSPEGEVNETVRHEWMTCRARANCWKEESSLLQEEMRRVIAFLEWKSSSWDGRVGSHSGTIMADIQHGINSYARKQAHKYHELAVSLVNQWLPHLSALGLDISWAKTYPWAAEIISPLVTLGARIPGTSDYMLRTLRALVKCTWILSSNNNLGTFEMYPQHLSNLEPLRKFW